jgi:hypothetical protein
MALWVNNKNNAIAMLANQHQVNHLNDPKLSRAKYWMLLHDNAPVCSLLV